MGFIYISWGNVAISENIIGSGCEGCYNLMLKNTKEDEYVLYLENALVYTSEKGVAIDKRIGDCFKCTIYGKGTNKYESIVIDEIKELDIWITINIKGI